MTFLAFVCLLTLSAMIAALVVIVLVWVNQCRRRSRRPRRIHSGSTGPTGPKGPRGLDGAISNTGAQGPVGGSTLATGSDGGTGPQGADGETGPPGVDGLAGPTGAKGDPGPEGPTGLTGTSVTGPRGPPSIMSFVGYGSAMTGNLTFSVGATLFCSQYVVGAASNSTLNQMSWITSQVIRIRNLEVVMANARLTTSGEARIEATIWIAEGCSNSFAPTSIRAVASVTDEPSTICFGSVSPFFLIPFGSHVALRLELLDPGTVLSDGISAGISFS